MREDQNADHSVVHVSGSVCLDMGPVFVGGTMSHMKWDEMSGPPLPPRPMRPSGPIQSMGTDLQINPYLSPECRDLLYLSEITKTLERMEDRLIRQGVIMMIVITLTGLSYVIMGVVFLTS